MLRSESRNDLPWSVAPIPLAPVLSRKLKLDMIVARLDSWFGELDHWLHIWRKRNALFFRRLPKIENQIRHLLQCAEEYLPEEVHRKQGFEKRSTLAAYHELLARCLSNANDGGKDEQAIKEFKKAISLAPEVADYWYSYIRHLVLREDICQALKEINSVDVHLIETEKESIAQQIINWALAYPEIGLGIHADLVQRCITLISQTRSGLLVRGCPPPHIPGEKWQRTEILRVLWAGMQCSIPVDELCKREGIDETTYYRWRKRYLPKEWGNELALV
jgi:hypothetical protein